MFFFSCGTTQIIRFPWLSVARRSPTYPYHNTSLGSQLCTTVVERLLLGTAILCSRAIRYFPVNPIMVFVVICMFVYVPLESPAKRAQTDKKRWVRCLKKTLSCGFWTVIHTDPWDVMPARNWIRGVYRKTHQNHAENQDISIITRIYILMVQVMPKEATWLTRRNMHTNRLNAMSNFWWVNCRWEHFVRTGLLKRTIGLPKSFYTWLTLGSNAYTAARMWSEDR